MLEKSKSVAPVVASDLNTAERTALLATRDLAQLMVSTTEANLNLAIAPFTSVKPLVVLHAAMAAALDTQQKLRRAHVQFEIIGRRLGLDETMWGGAVPKPDIALSEDPGIAHGTTTEQA